MRVIPVLDLLDGVVVRGVAGRRENYRPVESDLAATADAIEIAHAFRDRLRLSELYVADLDAILHGRSNASIYRSLAADGFEMMVDAGLRDAGEAEIVLSAGAGRVIAGLESITGPQVLTELCGLFGGGRIVFSLDLKGGEVLGDREAWESADAFEIGSRAAAAGVRQMIVLDLADVGMGQGVRTASLCRRFQEQFPDLQLIAGGGVRSAEDLIALRRSGIDAALVASALHDGRIGKRDIEAIHAA